MNDGQQQQAVEVVVRCMTWGCTAPWGQTTSETIAQPTVDAGLRLAAELAAKHCGGCEITVREGERIIESVRGGKPGEYEDCDDADEGRVLERMIAHHEDRKKIHARIVWAEGHGLIGDADTERLLAAALRHGVPLTEDDFPPRGPRRTPGW
jgi:ferredoxin